MVDNSVPISVVLTPEISSEKLIDIANKIADVIEDIAGNALDSATTAALKEFQRQLKDVTTQIDMSDRSLSKAAVLAQEIKTDTGGALEGAEGEREGRLSQMTRSMGTISQISSAMSGILKSFTKESLGVLENIYSRMKQASPLLQSVEQMFNLAMMLFFMPLGNKLAEILIPATVELLENVVKLWDVFDEGMTLGDMVSIAIKEGVTMLAEYFKDIGKALADQGGLVGSIGNLLLKLSNFIENHLVGILNTILNVVTWVVDNLGLIVGIITAMYVLQQAIGIAQLIVTAASSLRSTAALLAVAGTVGAAVTAGAIASSVTGYAEGGVIEPKDGGTLVKVAEAGEREYIIPESKMGIAGKGDTYNINISGLTYPELKEFILEIVNSQISNSKLRGGF